MKIYSAFPFCNELELLELRLREHWDYVDKFILVESTRTQQGSPKALHYNDNKSRFQEFSEKIIHLIYTPTEDDFVCLGENLSWLEDRQRRYIIHGLVESSENDIVMMSDADEIPDLFGVDLSQVEFPSHFEQILSSYYVNFRAPNCYLGGTIACRKRDFSWETIPHLRATHTDCPRIGFEYHFSWLVGEDGGEKRIEEKCHSIWEGIQAPYLGTDKFKEHALRCLQDGDYNLFGRTGDEYKLVRVDWDATFPKNMKMIVEKYPYLWKP